MSLGCLVTLTPIPWGNKNFSSFCLSLLTPSLDRTTKHHTHSRARERKAPYCIFLSYQNATTLSLMVILVNGSSRISILVSRLLRILVMVSSVWRISCWSLGVTLPSHGSALLSLTAGEAQRYHLEFECPEILVSISTSGMSMEEV